MWPVRILVRATCTWARPPCWRRYQFDWSLKHIHRRTHTHAHIVTSASVSGHDLCEQRTWARPAHWRRYRSNWTSQTLRRNTNTRFCSRPPPSATCPPAARSHPKCLGSEYKYLCIWLSYRRSLLGHWLRKKGDKCFGKWVCVRDKEHSRCRLEEDINCKGIWMLSITMLRRKAQWSFGMICTECYA